MARHWRVDLPEQGVGVLIHARRKRLWLVDAGILVIAVLLLMVRFHWGPFSSTTLLINAPTACQIRVVQVSTGTVIEANGHTNLGPHPLVLNVSPGRYRVYCAETIGGKVKLGSAWVVNVPPGKQGRVQIIDYSLPK